MLRFTLRLWGPGRLRSPTRLLNQQIQAARETYPERFVTTPLMENLRLRAIILSTLRALLCFAIVSFPVVATAMTSNSATSGSAKKTKAQTAKLQSPKVIGAAGLIAVAQHQFELGKFEAAADYATEASRKAPLLDDYAQYIRAQAQYQLKNYSE